jgi:hypothetical protein
MEARTALELTIDGLDHDAKLLNYPAHIEGDPVSQATLKTTLGRSTQLQEQLGRLTKKIGFLAHDAARQGREVELVEQALRVKEHERLEGEMWILFLEQDDGRLRHERLRQAFYDARSAVVAFERLHPNVGSAPLGMIGSDERLRAEATARLAKLNINQKGLGDHA